MSADDDEDVMTIRRVVVAEIKEISTTPVEGTNLAIFAGGDAAVLRLNEGPVGDDGRSKGYAVYHADQKRQRVKGRQGVGFRIKNQFIAPEIYDEHPDRWDRPANLSDRYDVDGFAFSLVRRRTRYTSRWRPFQAVWLSADWDANPGRRACARRQ